VVATLGKYIPMQNARMLQMLLAKHGGIFMLPDDFEKLPLYLQMGCIPIMSGMPPFGYWEKREEGSRIPQHRTDAGVFLSAEFLGARRACSSRTRTACTPTIRRRTRPRRHIPSITAAELVARRLPDVRARARRHRVPAPRAVVQGAPDRQRPQARSVLAALKGEDVGSIIRA